MFLLFIGLSFYPVIIPDKKRLLISGWLFPALYIIEFSFIFPLYVFNFGKLDRMGVGNFRCKVFCLCFVLLMLTQFLGAYIMDIRRQENWMVEQESVKGWIFWLNLFLLVFIVPVYEEFIFRGCLFRGGIITFKGNIYLSSLITSLLFAALHTQYNDIRTFVILFLVSMILIGAHVTSKGMVMPILLHMAMNATVLALPLIFNEIATS
ncbi:CPBP family intramembrane metalloprotease [Serratia nevei]|nr:CPBP family intramembrane metalloprotease [Serratia nevei]